MRNCFISGAVKQKNPDELHKIFYDRYVANQLNVKALLQKASNKKWMCDKSNFPGKLNSIKVI